jgi:hypothetical protein
MMMAADELRRGDGAAARSHLARVRGQEWSGPAAVLSASLSAGEGGAEGALATLDRAALVLDEYWIGQARRVMTTLPEENVEAWRNRHREELVEATGRTRWRIFGRWARLEVDSGILQELRNHLADEYFVSFENGPPAFPEGLAADLWRIGLEREAVRWDPSGFPRGEGGGAAWSAARFSEYDTPWTATRVADGAWRQAGSEVPNDALPVELQRSLYPLPMPELVRETAAAAGVDWSLLAAVAREESRWDHRALSAVGARGLLQLMPATSIAVASRIGLPEPSADDLFVPQVNFALGAAELRRLVAVFGGRNAPAIAAYNAGEEQAGLWLEQCGAGCSDGLYLVNISFASTRGYTAKVLASASRYSAIYGEDAEPVLETR